MTYQDSTFTINIKKILLPLTVFLLIMAAASTLAMQHLISYNQYNSILLTALGTSGLVAFMAGLKADTFLNRHKIFCTASFIWIMAFLVLMIMYLPLAWETSLFLTIAVCLSPVSVVFACTFRAAFSETLGRFWGLFIGTFLGYAHFDSSYCTEQHSTNNPRFKV